MNNKNENVICLICEYPVDKYPCKPDIFNKTYEKVEE